MKRLTVLFSVTFILISWLSAPGQEKAVFPSTVIQGNYLGITPALRDLPVMTEDDWREMAVKAELKVLNPKLEERSYPFAATALPRDEDPAWQKEMGGSRELMTTILNFDGQNSPYYPPDANGVVGPNHYMQTINTVYVIYNKSGTLVAGPTNLNLLFNGVTGSNCNDGDPIILYDDQADRWLAGEFSLCGSNDYMLIAVSTTNDPTGTWHAYSFDVSDVPDYEKFGIWPDGYYMGTNTYSGSDIYIFERDAMLNGSSARAVGFDNPWRPTSIDGFMCVPPVDNDGTAAPAGEPGLFIAFNDDAIAGGSDQLWIYELDVDWDNVMNSTFIRVQQINVSPFDSNFGNDWANIKQPGTTQEVDAIPMVVMNPPQYRNFGTYETLLCCHTVDVDNTDHAGIRWYELRRTAGSWSVRQHGTYAPDAHSRWMGSIMLNAADEIALGYSISSTSVYPGIRYCGQSASAYAAASGSMDLAEETILTGSNSQTTYDRWGDYSGLCVDASDHETFWYTNQYVGSSSARKTRIASFRLGAETLNANFTVPRTDPPPFTPFNLTDISTGSPTSWSWNFTPSTVTYMNGTTANSRHPQVSFDTSGYYTVSLTVSDGSLYDTETRTDYLHVWKPGMWYGATSTDWNTASNWDAMMVPTSSFDVEIAPTALNWPTFSGDFTIGTQCRSLKLLGSSQMTVTGNFTIGSGRSLIFQDNGELKTGGNWTNQGTFQPGTGTIRFTGASSASISGTGAFSGYTRSTFTNGMTALSGATNGPSGDDGASNVPIGFTFTFAQINYTQARICTNGWLSLNLSGLQQIENANLFNGSEPNTTIAGWWDDLADDNQSTVSYKTEGAAPNRVFTAEWYRLKTYYTVANSRISFQVKLYETSNIIELHFGNLENGSHHAGESASIGIEDATGGSGHFIEATTGSMTTGVTGLVTPGNWPAVNYRFTPAEFSESFYNVIVDKNGGALNFPVNVTVTNDFTLTPGSAFTIGNSKTLTVNGSTVR